jgi:hypothetical protein
VEFNVARNLVLGGAFRRLIDAQVQLRQFDRDLDAAGSIEECWRVLQGGCNSFGYTGLKLAVDGRVFEQMSAAQGEGCWSVRIPLEGNSYVNLMREFGESPHAAVIAPLAEIIRGRLCEKLPTLRRYVEVREPLVRAAAVGGD